MRSSATKAQKLALEDRLLAALRIEGPLATGQLARLCGPYFETRRHSHGAWTVCDGERKWLECCSHMETVEVDPRYMAPTIRAAMKRLQRRGLVMELQGEIPYNHGGNIWMLLEVGS